MDGCLPNEKEGSKRTAKEPQCLDAASQNDKKNNSFYWDSVHFCPILKTIEKKRKYMNVFTKTFAAQFEKR